MKLTLKADARARALLMGLGLTTLAACGSSPQSTEAQGAQGESSGGTAEGPRRARPGRRAIARALSEAAERASGCLPQGVNAVDVQGAFLGATGAFSTGTVLVEGAPVSGELAACVRTQFDAARVEPFREERAESAYTVVRGANASSPSAAGALAALANPQPAPAVAGSAAPSAAPSFAPPPVIASASAPPSPPPPPPPTTPPPVVAASAAAAAPAAPTASVANTAPQPLEARQLGACATTASRLDPTVAGEARISFSISADGVVRDLRTDAQGTPRGRAAVFTQFLRCAEQRLRTAPQLRRFAGGHDLLVQLAPAAEIPGGVAVRPFVAGAAATGAVASAAPAAPTAAGDASGAMLDPGQVANVVRARADALRECYRAQLAHSPMLRVRMRARIVVEPAGVVSHSSSASVLEAGDPEAGLEVGRCAETVLRATSFPARAAGGPVELVLPLAFAPEHSTNAASVYGAGPAAQPAYPPGAMVPAGAPVPTPGRVDPAAVSQTIRGQMPALQSCFTRQLAVAPGLAGRIYVRFVVDPMGRVVQSNSTIEPHGGDPRALGEVARCIDGFFVNIPMPPPMGGAASVTLPLDFGI